MKILLINKFHYRRGGSETYYFALAEALKAKGHDVVFFAMQDKNNADCEQAEFFVSSKDYNNGGSIGSKINAVKSFYYSHEAAEKMEKLIAKEKPDIAHVGLLHRQITFSVVEVLKKHNIPVVMTMHDLIFACPNYTMLTHGKICEACLEGSTINCIKNTCVKNSKVKSAMAALEKKYLVRKKYYDYIDLYITPTEYYKSLMEKSKITTSPIKAITNFLPIGQKYEFDARCEDYVLYFGRLSEEKGIMTLLKAHKISGCKRKLMIVGNGPQADDIRRFAEDNGLTNIEMPGALYGEELDGIVKHAKVVIVPSEWYENCPYSVLESQAKGKIVIASNIGGLPELIDDNKTGFLFEAGNAADLNRTIELVFDMSQTEYSEMSNAVVRHSKERYYWEKYIDVLTDEYKRLKK